MRPLEVFLLPRFLPLPQQASGCGVRHDPLPNTPERAISLAGGSQEGPTPPQRRVWATEATPLSL